MAEAFTLRQTFYRRPWVNSRKYNRLKTTALNRYEFFIRGQQSADILRSYD